MRAAAGAVALGIGLLGGFQLWANRVAVRLPFGSQRLLAFLALRERPVLRSHVAGALWPETTEARAAASLRSALWRLGPVGPDLVSSSGRHLQLAPTVAVDLRRSVALARRLLDPAEPVPERGVAISALARDLLPDWFDEWVVVERESFRQLRLHALEALCARLTDLGRWPEAVEAGLAAVAAEPLRESAHRALIRAHLAEGNAVEAMHQYEAFRRLLLEELGLEPSPAIRALLVEARGVTVG
ncbi:MAG TPA: BTAD domain-containing putative transcriptional regulator [Actinomycetota bacterium]|nr:BTAD domain-containing putative transcriptional regulator [Actinomycetota bacterium]